MESEKFQKEITKRLNVIIRLLATSSLKDATVTDEIYFLHKSGFSPKEISEMLNTTGNYVNVILSKMRKKEKKEKDIEDKMPDETSITTPDSEVQNG